MDKRKDLRDYYQNQEERLQDQTNFNSRTQQIDDFETTIVNAFNSLIRYMNGSVSKTEVVNQLDTIKNLHLIVQRLFRRRNYTTVFLDDMITKSHYQLLERYISVSNDNT